MVNYNNPYSQNTVTFLENNAATINSVAAILGVNPYGIAGGIARELTNQDTVYANDPVRQIANETVVPFALKNLSRTSRNQKGCAIIRAGAANWRGDDAGRAC